MVQSTMAAARKPRGSPKQALKRLTLLAIAVGCCLLLLEGMTRVIYNRDGMHFGIEMWKYAKQLKRTSPNADMGHEHVPGREAFLMGVPVRINSAGLRDREFTLEKPADTYRILVLGDSITFGWGVRQEKTFAKVLEQRLNDQPLAGRPRHVEVLNTGVGNYNTAQEVAYFKERGRQYQPDAVILAFFINDAEETPREEQNWLARESCLYVFASSAWDGILRHFSARPNYRDYYLDLYEEGRPGWTACQRALRELMALCRQEHIDLRIAIVPELHTLGDAYEFRKVHDAVRAIAAEDAVPVLDLLDALAGQDPPSLWVSPGDAHPNERANELFAGQLEQAFRSDRSKGRPRDKTEAPRPSGD
jgi:lysophospholipase L1-like esterase